MPSIMTVVRKSCLRPSAQVVPAQGHRTVGTAHGRLLDIPRVCHVRHRVKRAVLRRTFSKVSHRVNRSDGARQGLYRIYSKGCHRVKRTNLRRTLSKASYRVKVKGGEVHKLQTRIYMYGGELW